MIDNSASRNEIYRQLTATYDQLSPPGKELVQLFSICYEAVSRSSFLGCVNTAGIRDQRGKLFTVKSLKPVLDRLVELELLYHERNNLRCQPLLVEIATREAIREKHFDAQVKAVRQSYPVTGFGRKNTPPHYKSKEQLLREVRIGIYRREFDYAFDQITHFNKPRFFQEEFSLNDVLLIIFNNPFDQDWLRRLPVKVQYTCLWDILLNAALLCEPAEDAFACLKKMAGDPAAANSHIPAIMLVEQLLLRGQLETCEQHLASLPKAMEPFMLPFKGWLAFLKGDNEEALRHFTEGLAVYRKQTKKRTIFFNDIPGIFFILALLKTKEFANLNQAVEYCNKILRQEGHWLGPIYAVFKMVLLIQQGSPSSLEKFDYEPGSFDDNPNKLSAFLHDLGYFWVSNRKETGALISHLAEIVTDAHQSGILWLAAEAAELIFQLQPQSSYGRKAAEWRDQTGIHSIVNLVGYQEPWKLALKALASLDRETAKDAKPETECRLAWFIREHFGSYHLQPKEQKLTTRGSWTKGRNIALKRLATKPGEFPYITAQDLRLCTHIDTYTYGYYGQIQYEFNERAIPALAGHPLVFWEDAPETRIEVVKGEPQLLVKKKKDGSLELEFSPADWQKDGLSFIKESPLRLKVVEVNAGHRRVAELLPGNRLQVPAEAEEQVLKAIKTVSTLVTVHSDIGTGAENAEQIAADSQPCIHLLPAGEGLKITLLVRPFGQDGPCYRAGEGGSTVIAEISGKRLQTTRDLDNEKTRAEQVIEACPVLDTGADIQYEWLLDDPEDCLNLLLELQDLGDAVTLEWPEGGKLSIRSRAGLENFKLSIHRQRDWFAAEGELKLDDDMVLDMQALLKLTEQTPSRIVPLGEGQFLALTREFRKRLDELRSYGENFGKGVRFHPLAAPALEDFAAEVGNFSADEHWQEYMKRLAAAQTLETALPSTLQAELRDYQEEGFQWLARLAHTGMGACLADDMGLGKTLQALAVILTRAPQGPTLVVAPTSVCMNWVSEAERFAPTLNPIQFNNNDRRQLLNRLQPFDMLICSYGLLQQQEVAQLLGEIEWQTIVLDEAQAIKNFTTKRSQAAMKLQSGFKLITTGTPIENHLGEFWNLFRFINPGLLGSLESFNRRFAAPIEKDKDKQARTRLKKLIQPFLLRRTKSQVLEELPSRTEVLLHVDLSPEELAFYEALRREAVDKLSAPDAGNGGKRFQVLAEIMKLRRACCNARLVTAETRLPSAKLQLFSEVLEELLESRHKALVFSQFVGHLGILREYLDAKHIAYQYLDGSTPARERKKRVNAFQAGEGDVFLISLKAGGTGLNLTAADYVIHMDPWWNPAVEDQASDRAHRIGQVRPVTIYRLVARGTIEDKIVDLHHHKRDLADSLLEGADMEGKISTDELLELIREG